MSGATGPTIISPKAAAKCNFTSNEEYFAEAIGNETEN